MKLLNFNERELRPYTGFAMLFTLIAGTIFTTFLFVFGIALAESGIYLFGTISLIVGILGLLLCSIMFAGLKLVHPNEARVFTLFGKYHGTIKVSGYHYVNPFCVSFSPDYNAAKAHAAQMAKTTNPEARAIQAKAVAVSRAVSLKTQTLDNNRQKVNDVLGNPIIIGAVVIWHVEWPTQAVFAVENYQEFLSIQTDSTIRNVARLYPYDVFDEDEHADGVQEKTLRGSALEIADSMQAELQKRVSSAGLIIEEVRITHLAYAEEIAAAMLQRQQAVAIIAARQKIVDGAVGMVKMAIDRLNDDNIVVLDDERKAVMVSNLLVVLCGSHDAQPVVNTGSIY
jgi:regulator of protease activity HflC (stomatin/prohibitin superfamily)